MNYTCKYCGKPIFWMTPDHRPRWVHGTSKSNWISTPCIKIGNVIVKTDAAPGFKYYIDLIK